MKKHQKHIKLDLRKAGFYAATEIAILGTKCDVIKHLLQNIAEKLQVSAKIGYLDASHNQDNLAPILDEFTFNDSGILNTKSAATLNKFKTRIQFSPYDLLLINGNHYQGNQQIIILDNNKEASITKRIDQITDIKFFIKLQKDSKIFDCVKAKFKDFSKIPIYDISDLDSITTHIAALISDTLPPVNGLVLVGGKSTRMGTDKSLLNYHGTPQRDHLIHLMSKVLGDTSKVYLSVRAEQAIDYQNCIADTFLDLGPFGALCSAFRHNPNAAYLVVAADLPFVNQDVLDLLISKRNPKKIATALKGHSSEFVEPLICIWEPKAYPVLLQFLAQGYSCPRKVLINSDVEIVEVADEFIQNINTPEEFNQVKKQRS